jgi:colicin import membrane protein
MIGKGSMPGWRQAFILALAFHVAVFLLFFFSPSLWHKKVRMPPVYNVQLFEPPQAVKTQTGSKARTLPRRSAVKKVVKKRPVKVARKAPKPPPKKKVSKKAVKKTSTAKKAVSLKPKKVVKKKPRKQPEKKKVARVKQKQKVQKRVNEEKELSRRIRRIQERVAEKKEEEILKERLARLKKKVRSGPESLQGSGSSAAGARGAAVNDALRRYAGAIWMHVRKNWHFPEELLKRKDLEAIVSIRVDRKGHIMSRQFEKRSGFPAFDRSVLKAVSDSDPLPPLPPQLMPGPIEIGIRFNPSRMNSP